MAKEALRLVCAIFMLETRHVVRSGVGGKESNVLAALTSLDAGPALRKLVVGFWVESNALKMLAALVAGEALRMEARASCRNDATGNGQSTRRTKSAGTDVSRCPVGASVGRSATTKRS
jgi:hypothetical protein